MPDTLSRKELTKLRESVRLLGDDDYSLHWSNHAMSRLLAHLDALTAAVEELDASAFYCDCAAGYGRTDRHDAGCGGVERRAAVLSLIRGKRPWSSFAATHDEPDMPPIEHDDLPRHDALSRFAMVGDLNDRHMAPVADGNYVLYLDYRAHTGGLMAERDALRQAAQEYFEASLPLLNGYPLTDGEGMAAWVRLRKTNAALRAVLGFGEPHDA